MLTVLDLADLYVSKYDLSAFFRKPDHNHYRKCKDQIMRNFLYGLQLKFRGKYASEGSESAPGAPRKTKRTPPDTGD